MEITGALAEFCDHHRRGWIALGRFKNQSISGDDC
jgi:hypothetical protein